eukprot:gene25155-10786_t
MIEALAPLDVKLEEVHLFSRFIVDEDVIRAIAGQLTHVRTLYVYSCKMVEGSRAALHEAGIVLEDFGGEESSEEYDSEEDEDEEEEGEDWV